MSKTRHDLVITVDLERAEALLLGSMFHHPEKVKTVRAMLQPEDFSQDRHRMIYETLLTVTGTSERDLVEAMSILLTQDELESIGGLPYLSLLKQQAESMTLPLAEQVYQLKQAILNRLLSQTRETLYTCTAQNDGLDLKHVIGDLERAISMTQQLFSPKHELASS